MYAKSNLSNHQFNEKSMRLVFRMYNDDGTPADLCKYRRVKVVLEGPKDKHIIEEKNDLKINYRQSLISFHLNPREQGMYNYQLYYVHVEFENELDGITEKLKGYIDVEIPQPKPEITIKAKANGRRTKEGYIEDDYGFCWEINEWEEMQEKKQKEIEKEEKKLQKMIETHTKYQLRQGVAENEIDFFRNNDKDL